MSLSAESLRKNAFILARNSYTPVGYWLGLPLRQLAAWVDTNNDVVDEMNEDMKKKR